MVDADAANRLQAFASQLQQSADDTISLPNGAPMSIPLTTERTLVTNILAATITVTCLTNLCSTGGPAAAVTWDLDTDGTNDATRIAGVVTPAAALNMQRLAKYMSAAPDATVTVPAGGPTALEFPTASDMTPLKLLAGVSGADTCLGNVCTAGLTTAITWDLTTTTTDDSVHVIGVTSSTKADQFQALAHKMNGAPSGVVNIPGGAGVALEI